VISDDGAKNAKGEIFKFTTGDDPKFFVRVNDKEDEFSPSQLCSVKSPTDSTETSEGDKAVAPVDPPFPVAPAKEPTETGPAIGAVGDESKVPEESKATGASAVGGGKPFRTSRKLNRYSESESASALSSSIGGGLTESFDLTTGSYTYSSSNSKSSARSSGRSSNKTSSHSSRLSESSVKSSSHRSSSNRSSTKSSSRRSSSHRSSSERN
jgi:hypothetical protein